MIVWKNIPDFEGVYSASINGEIKRISTGKILKPTNNGNGYFYVRLCKNNIVKRLYVHRLIALTFLKDIKEEVNHKDLDKANNKLSNLEWVTGSQNKLHSFKNGSHPKGKDNNLSKYSKQKIEAILKDLKLNKLSLGQIALKHKVSKTHVHTLKHGKTRKHIEQE